MIRGVILEGLSTAGKTSVFTALKKAHNQTPGVARTLIAISEHYSQVLHSDQGILRSLKHQEHINLMNPHIEYLEKQYKWINALGHTKPSNGIFYIFERLHLNHRAAYAEERKGIEMLEQRLLNLNAHCVLLTLSSDRVESRFVESRGTEWRSYVMQYHSSVEAASLQFLEDQEKLRNCAKQSLIPTLEINTDEADWDAYAKQILDVC